MDEYGHMRVAIQDIKNPYNVMSTLCNLISKDSYEEEKITLRPDKNSIYPYFQDTVFGFILGLAASIIAVLIWISSGAELFDKKYNPHSDIPYIITVCVLVFTVFYPPYSRFMRKQKIYKIGKNTIQSKEGIINHNLKIIHTKNTKGIILKRGPFEKKYNLGNIKIFSTVRNGEIGREEIIMENLKNADKIYEKLKNFLDNDNTNDNIITPKYCIRPHFSLSAQMFPVVIVTSLVLIITSAVEFCIDYSFSDFIYYFIPALFISALTGYIIMCANYISCKNTKYNFYPDKAENVKRIFEEKKACVYYGNIYRVTTRENYFQKLNNMGSIYLVTADTKSKKFEFSSSIKFVDIKYAKDLCKKINEDIEKTKNKLFT